MTTRSLHAGAASAALILGLGLMASPAMAFDTVNWSWVLTRTDTSTNTSTSALTALPTGDATLQARQIYLGDVIAQSDGQATALPATTPVDGPSDLGHVESGASAYANVYSAASEAPLSVNLGQFHAGDVSPTSGATPTVADPLATNASHAYADGMIADAGTGFLTPHETLATANAVGIVDATAATDARAVSNTASLELAAAPAELAGADPTGGYVTNALMATDVTQLSIGRVDATATTSVTLNGADNLGGLDRPIAAATATAIGNLTNVTARVGVLEIGF